MCPRQKKNRIFSVLTGRRIKDLFLPQLSTSKHHQECSHSYATSFLEVAPELSPLCLALLAKFFGVFGLVTAAFLAFVPEFLSHPYLTTFTRFPFLSWCVAASGRVSLRPTKVPSIR